MLALALLLLFAALFILITVVPTLQRDPEDQNKQMNQFINKYDSFLQEDEIKKAYKYTLIGPIAFAVIGFLVFPGPARIAGLVLGLIMGFVAPRMYISGLISKRRAKFNDQLMDALMIMSSSFRGGLSLIQAIEAVVDEMPDPIRQEFGIVLGENKMGVGLDDSLNRLYKRMTSPALQQMITAIILARETGGNLPVIFSRIVSTMRERKKIEQNLVTLTIQGKIQAVVMTGLPVLFYFAVTVSNPRFFDRMFTSPDGQKILIYCLTSWIIGAVFIWKISKFKEV